MAEWETRHDRRDRHARELEESQQRLRESIHETERLLTASEEMLKRHRRESDEAENLDDGGDGCELI